MEKEFTDWYEENESRFHSGQFYEKEIAYSAWLEGRNNTARIQNIVKYFTNKNPMPSSWSNDILDYIINRSEHDKI